MRGRALQQLRHHGGHHRLDRVGIARDGEPPLVGRLDELGGLRRLDHRSGLHHHLLDERASPTDDAADRRMREQQLERSLARGRLGVRLRLKGQGEGEANGEAEVGAEVDAEAEAMGPTSSIGGRAFSTSALLTSF